MNFHVFEIVVPKIYAPGHDRGCDRIVSAGQGFDHGKHVFSRHILATKDWDDLTCNILCLLILLVAGILLGIGLQNTMLASTNISYLWHLGFGAVTSESMVA